MLTILILPIVCGVIFYTYAQKQEELSEILAKSILTYEAFVVLMANLLSIGSHLNRVSVFLFWLLVTILFVGVGFFIYHKSYFEDLKTGRTIKRMTTALKEFRTSLGLCEWVMLTVMGILLLILLFGALFTVPYNYDSMTYHLARIGHWMDNGNVNYYVTNIDRQLFSPVLAEYNLLAVMLLCGNDFLLNLSQYIAMLLTAYFLYKIARMLKTSRIFSLFAAFAYLTMPLTITQAITTQNDLSAGLFFALFVYELLWFVKTESLSDQKLLEKSIRIGMTVGFAFLMKVSICASMILFMPWVICVCIKRKDSVISLIKAAVAAGVSLALVIAETLIRTYQACGSFTSDTTSGDIMVATKNVSYILVNILKNYSLLITQHFWTALNGFVYRIAIHVGALLHVEVNNIAIAYHGFDFITYLNTGDDMYSHDRTSSAFVSYLALIAGVLLVIALIRYFVWLIIQKKQMKTKPFGEREVSFGYVISAWLGFGFIMALLRWQPWGSRLMYPALTMTVVASAHMLDVFCQKQKNKAIVLLPLIALSTLLCIKPVTYNMTESVDYVKGGCSDRMQHYFVHNDRLQTYYELLGIAKGQEAKDIAVVISGDGYDYPLWKVFHELYPEGSMRHILVDDEQMVAYEPQISGKKMKGVNIDGQNAKGLAKTLDAPDCILWIEKDKLEIGDTLDYFGTTYECVFVSAREKSPDSILIRKDR